MPYEGIPTLDDLEITGKRVLLRAAYDVPLETVDGVIRVADDTRIRVSVPTIKRLLAADCSIVICGGKIGRPQGGVVPELRMDPVATRLSELLNRPVQKLDECVGEAVEQAANRLQPGEIILLENARFYPGEATKDPAFIEGLARLAELCVFDGFAEAHRDMATTTGLVRAMPTVLGPVMVKELSVLEQVSKQPDQPFVVVMGGAKITDKIALLRRLVESANTILVGGALANTFLKARGASVGRSLVESMDIEGSGVDPLELAREIVKRAGDKLLLPTDVVIGDDPKRPTDVRTIILDSEVVPDDRGIYDIGPATAERFASVIAQAKTVFWNGSLGVNTTPDFEAGTRRVSGSIATNRSATTVVGGGDTEQAVHQFGLDGAYTHVSTGGGASLTVVSGTELAVIKTMKEAAGRLPS